MNTAGLSLEQAPSLRLVYPFYLIASLCGMLAGASFLFEGNSISADNPHTIAGVHLYTIGFLVNAIFASLLQLLPVVLGISITKSRLVRIGFGFFILGIMLFVIGFYGNDIARKAAVGFLGLGGLLICGYIAWAIFAHNDANTLTIRNFRIAVSAGIVCILLGLWLLSAYAYDVDIANMNHIRDVHIIIAVFGFTGTLIITVSHIVLPMFYVTPKFPPFCRYWPLVIAILCASLFFANDVIEILAKIGIGVAFCAFGVVGLKKIHTRKRLLSDASLKFWQLGLVSLLCGLLVWGISAIYPFSHSSELCALCIGVGFLGSIVQAMIQKIVPFLVWFHLTNLGKWDAPNVREIITDTGANIQFYCFVATIIILGTSFFVPAFFLLGSGLFAMTFAILFVLLVRAVLLFERHASAVLISPDA